jgi:hypothetical protein
VLVGSFVAERNQAAFAELVRRHGPMVLAVCRRITGHARASKVLQGFQSAGFLQVSLEQEFGDGDMRMVWIIMSLRRCLLRPPVRFGISLEIYGLSQPLEERDIVREAHVTCTLANSVGLFGATGEQLNRRADETRPGE